MGLQRAEIHKHNKFALKLPNRVWIHTQVCLTQVHDYSSTHSISRAVRRVLTSYLTRDSHRNQYSSDIFLLLCLMMCYKSVGPRGDLSLGRSELCLFLATIFLHLLLTMWPLDLHPRDTFYSNTRQSEEYNGSAREKLRESKAWNCFSQGKKIMNPSNRLMGTGASREKKKQCMFLWTHINNTIVFPFAQNSKHERDERSYNFKRTLARFTAVIFTSYNFNCYIH